MNSLREYGTTYKTGGGAGGCFELSGNTLQEAADNIFPPCHLLIIKYHQLSGMSTHFFH